MSSLPSFFLPPNAVRSTVVIIHESDIIRQMRKVLRLKPDDQFIVLDGSRQEYLCRITHLDHTEARATIVEQKANTRETAVSVFLYPALIRRERFALVLEKCTELGVAGFYPVAAARSPFRDIAPNLQTRSEHIIREAAELARRGILPALQQVQTLNGALAAIPKDETIVVLSTAPAGSTLSVITSVFEKQKPIHLFVGPEGDYTEEEYALFAAHGALALSLGPRIVRSETATIAAVNLFTSLQ